MANTTGVVQVGRGKSFRVVVNDQYGDHISKALAAGGFWMAAEWDLIASFLPRRGRLLDLGGHVGSFSLTAATLGHDVLTVEASPANAALIRESAALNGFTNLRLFHAAAHDQESTLRFFNLGPWGFVAGDGADARVTEVPARPVDDILADAGWDRVDVIKMDVEGSEVRAIRGMRRLLERPDAPVIFYECNGHPLHHFGGTSCQSLKAELEAFGYRSHVPDFARRLLTPVSAGDPQPRTLTDYLAFKPGQLTADRSPWLTARSLARRCLGRGPSLPRVRGWKVGAPLSQSELLRAFRVAVQSADHPHDREHLGREVRSGPAWLRSAPEMQAFLAVAEPTAARAA